MLLIKTVQANVELSTSYFKNISLFILPAIAIRLIYRQILPYNDNFMQNVRKWNLSSKKNKDFSNNKFKKMHYVKCRCDNDGYYHTIALNFAYVIKKLQYNAKSRHQMYLYWLGLVPSKTDRLSPWVNI